MLVGFFVGFRFQQRDQLGHGYLGFGRGGMSKLIAAAKKEGTLNVIALPDLGELRNDHQHVLEEVRDQG